ncbi:MULTISPECIES: GNAT family N-acetyltransferase [unclassified Gordonia (in: high G+C Gram-positive bacteria)]|uniref:GNAT family N-acetyltransferase n=1 Tax=unclassified Gordonia (in: high G+C Gram-positive bacteria) TaxID=2657482 RepID=UPI001963EC2D|nr:MULTISPECIES: GNAT family N-acetyltransferase [unclassified Gordonia (in: high G+C Gram-positive bacteria)]MBN0975136.1 GNAT family N-acetyltransferase [Gordonia sp. BP-119]MBN0981579.1 GNAT family N-acetyltransferase [Gordonia sp. BP-94]
MTDITYRPYRSTDAEDVKKIIDEAFYIHRYVHGQHVLDAALEVYLREQLVASTWSRVAVKDGRVVGIILGRIDGEPHLGERTKNRALLWAHTARAAILGLPQWKSLRALFAFESVAHRLGAATGTSLDDELTLFAVASTTRGHGVGATLYRAFLDHLRDRDRSDFHLYTDSLCTFGFYERQGMSRAGADDMDILLDGEPHTLGVYIYTGAAS